MKNIAIMGGTFNPIHMGHLIAAQCVYETGEFEKILFMPSNRPPHKDERSILSAEHRLAMCQLAIKDYSGFYASDYELLSTGKTYSVDTFQRLKKEDSTTNYWLIIGTDSLFNLEHWYEAATLLKIGRFIVVDRGGFNLKEVETYMSNLNRQYHTLFKKISMPKIELSSHSLRRRVAKGRSIRYRTADNVISYIEEHALYKDLR